MPQFLRHAVECLSDAASNGGEGVAVAAEDFSLTLIPSETVYIHE